MSSRSSRTVFPQVEQGEDDLADDHRQRVWQDVLLLLVRRLWRWGHHQPQDLQVRKWQVVGHMAVTGQLWMSGLGFLCCDVIGKPMMGRTWIGWTTTIMISLGKISAKAKTTMKTGIYHQWVFLDWFSNLHLKLRTTYVRVDQVSDKSHFPQFIIIDRSTAISSRTKTYHLGILP